MKHIISATFIASALLLAVAPAMGGGGGRVIVAPQQTVVVSHQEAVITPRPFLVAQRELFVPAGMVVPSTFAAFRAFHHHFGHVIVFVDPTTRLVWPSGFWAWNGNAWLWVPQRIAW